MAENPHTERALFALSVVRFGPFELDLRSAELHKNGSRIRLQGQLFQILCLLLERPGAVVLREEIRHELWPDNIVVEFDHSINAAVKRLRDALRDSAEQPRYIETLPKIGYRFIAGVEPLARQPVALRMIQPLRSAAPAAKRADSTRRPWIPSARALAAVTGVLLLAAALGIAWYSRTTPARWARKVAVPTAIRLIHAGDHGAAFPFLFEALQVLPNDPELNSLRREISFPFSIRTTPAGASIYLKSYGDPGGRWLYIGHSPLHNFLLPIGYFRWRLTKPGFESVEGAAGVQALSLEFLLDREGSVPPEMVHVPEGNFQLFGMEPVRLSDYWMDKHEVTNRQYKEFVDKGGYKDRQYWHEEFTKDGRVVSWEQAVAEFHDTTGRPGPSTWEVGGYAQGRDEFPVTGVSWYEAAAYAEFAHKQLPTVYHWYRAAGQGIYSDILHFSNFDGTGPVTVGSREGLGSVGTYDMAGNVKEWCWNATGKRRYILGGGWNEEPATFVTPDALSPFDRSPANGFRCVKYPGGSVPQAITRAVENPRRDHRTEKPVSDRVFRILQNFYAYDHTGLKGSSGGVGREFVSLEEGDHQLRCCL